MSHTFKLGADQHSVALVRLTDGYRFIQSENNHLVSLEKIGTHRYRLTLDDQVIDDVFAYTHGDTTHVHLNGETLTLNYIHPLLQYARQDESAAADVLKAPMPGTVVSISTEVGAAVKKGQALMVIESMKLETTLLAPRDGVVEQVPVSTGKTFERDSILLRLAPLGDES